MWFEHGHEQAVYDVLLEEMGHVPMVIWLHVTSRLLIARAH